MGSALEPSISDAEWEARKASDKAKRDAARRVFDGLSGLCVLADEGAAGVWTKAQVLDQIRALVGDVHVGLWHDCLVVTRED